MMPSGTALEIGFGEAHARPATKP